MYDRKTSRRLLYTLFLSQSLFSASYIAIFTLVAIVATRLSGTESLAGLPSSTQTFTQALAALPIALMMGRFGRRLGLTVAYGTAALGGIVGMLAVMQGNFPLLLVSAILLGVGRAGGDQSRFAAGELFPEAERARMIGVVVFAGTIGAVVGPVLVSPSGRLMGSLGMSADVGPWAVAFGLCILSALVMLLLLRPDPLAISRVLADDEARRAVDAAEFQSARPLRSLLTLPAIQIGILAMLIGQTVMVILMVMTPLHMDHHQHTRDAISLVISAHTLGMFGLSALTGYLIDRFGRVQMIVAGALTLIAAALLAPASLNEYILALALFLLGLGWNFCYVSGSSILAGTLQGAERARVQGINDTLVFFVAGIGSLGAGPLFAAGDYLAISVTALGLSLVLIALIYRLTRPQLQTRTI